VTLEEALCKYENKRKHCKSRGILFTLTFKDWADAWGEWISECGRLQLQRKDKALGFVVGNVVVGERPKHEAQDA
jgi:hypothetical protein